SFKATGEIMTTKPPLLPKMWLLDNYVKLFSRLPFARNYMNTATVSLVHTSLILFLCSLGGFAFAKLRFPGRDSLFLLLVSTMMIPGVVQLVPSFFIMARLHWLDTYWPLIVPGAANAYGIFLMRQYAAAIPDELLDAARIDGCSTLRTYWSVAVPVLQSGLTVLGIIFFMGTWNDFFWPLIVLKSKTMYTIPVALATLREMPYEIPYGATLAGATLSGIPLVLLFLFFQRWFISGILAGALKG
ncbi:MAG: carbohydrate ABC transporter permease, partial [Anaerolineae bacterium]